MMSPEHVAALIARNKARKGVYKHSAATRANMSAARYRLLIAGRLPGQQLRNFDKAAALGLLDHPHSRGVRVWREPAWQCRRCRQPHAPDAYLCTEHLAILKQLEDSWP